MKTSGRWRVFFFLVDVALINLGFYLAFVVRFMGHVPKRNLIPFLDALPYISLLAFILLWGFEVYQEEWQRLTGSLTKLLMAVLLVNIGTMALTFWLRGFAFPRTVFLLAATIQLSLLSLWRLAVHLIHFHVEGHQHIVIVGSGDEADDMAARVAESGGRWVTVTQVPVETKFPLSDSGDSSLSTISRASIVYLCRSVSRDYREAIVSWCLEQDKQVGLVPDVFDIVLHNADKWSLGDMPVFSLRSLSLTPAQKLLKRVEDLVMGLLLSAFTLLVAPIVAVMIKLTSPGPVLYRQERVGLDGRTFNIYKFRTMTVDAENKTGPVLATRNDPRVTSVGRFLRATRLDEIPQVLNILRGEMSFVGPRPERPVFVEQLADQIPAYTYRLKVKPGVTGLAQVRGRYDTDPARKLLYDLYYIKNYSLPLDFKILLQTVLVVIKPEAALGRAKTGGERLRERDSDSTRPVFFKL